MPKLTILVPVYNEEQVVPLFFERMEPVVQQLLTTHEVALTFINTASTANTLKVVRDLCDVHPYVFMIGLAKNVGYQRSIECGLRNSTGDLFAFIDVDCEDPPEMILQFIEAQQAAYRETCVEDDEIALRMDAGRKALMLRGDNEFGPYQSPMEDGMQHFHEWYRREMGASKTTQMI